MADRLLSWFLKDELWEEVTGDLYEKYEEAINAKTVWAAKANYWYQVLNYVRPFALRKKLLPTLSHSPMLRNYLLIAARNISKHKFHSTINILSLAIGIAAALAIYLFVADERSFDQQHSKKDNLYRLCEVQSFPGTNTQKVALSMPGMGPAFERTFPDVVEYTRYWNRGKWVWDVADSPLALEANIFVDSTFFSVFDFPLLSGDVLTCLDEPRSVVLTKESALKMFNTTDVVGRTLPNGEDSYEITGVLDEIPEHSHLQFDALISITTFTRERPELNNWWGSNFMVTYFHMTPDADIKAMAERYPELMIEWTGNENINEMYKLFLQPLDEVHLGSTDIEHDYQNYRKFNGEYLDIFLLVAAFILIIATVNFTNLSVARATKRAKEIGVRKSIGAQRMQLFWQFIAESVLMAFMALIIAMILDGVGLYFLSDALDRDLTLLTLLENPLIPMGLLLFVVLLGFVAGSYPALHLSSFAATTALKGGAVGEKKSLFQSVLIVTQFSLALAMIISTLIVVNQLNYMKNKDLGFKKDHIVVVDMNDTANEKFDLIKEQLLGSTNIVGVTASGQRLGSNFHQWGWKASLDTGMLELATSNVLVEYDYLDVYGIKLLAGRTFSKDFATDDGLAFIVNKALADELGVEDPIGVRVGHQAYPNDSLGTIIGVTENFNFNSLHYKVNTLSMVVHTDWNYDEMSIKLNGQNIQAGLGDLDRIWTEHVPDFPLDYDFLDMHFEELYQSDSHMGVGVTIIAILAIIVGCMGLFGLSAITIERRIKEVGIRKVLGASVSQLLMILSSKFALLIAISFVLAAPVTYYFLREWLTNFAFSISINPLIFVLGGVMALLIAMLTISYHTLRAANTNPVKSLRYE